jgi:transposase-like protein
MERLQASTDILIACCDGLNGFEDAIHAAFPHTVVQTCVVVPFIVADDHMLRMPSMITALSPHLAPTRRDQVHDPISC